MLRPAPSHNLTPRYAGQAGGGLARTKFDRYFCSGGGFNSGLLVQGKLFSAVQLLGLKCVLCGLVKLHWTDAA
jgi:hypothetical protein